MKNGLLIWNVLLTVIAGYLLIAHFSQKKAIETVSKTNVRDTLSTSGAFRMAYFEMDSVENNFQIVKDIKAEMNKRQEQINNDIGRQGQALQQKYNNYQAQLQAGRLTQQQADEELLEIRRMDEQIKENKQSKDEEYNNYVMRNMKDIKTKIEDFLKEYNKDRRYAYIISYEQGLFYYRDSIYNITSDVIRGLNEMYKNKKQ
jgi:outer membrane protein